MWSDPRIGTALWNTLTITITRLGIGVLIALPAAWLLARTNVPGVRWLEFGVWLSFFLPPLAAIQGWSFLLEEQVGLLNQWSRALVGADLPFVFHSFWGVVWTHLVAGTITGPIILLTLAFRNVDASIEEASLVSGETPAGTFRRVTLPAIRPTFAILSVLMLIRGLQSFEIERVIGTPARLYVYGTLVVDLVNSEPSRLEEAVALSAFILVILVPLIVAQRLWGGRRPGATMTGRLRSGRLDLGQGRWLAGALLGLLVALVTVVPLVALVVGSFMTRWGFFQIREPWTLRNWQLVFSDSTFTQALQTTILLGFVAALVAMVASGAVAYVLVRSRFAGRGLLEFTSWLPWTIPGVLLSLGILTVVLQLPLLRPLHGSFPVLVAAVVLLGFPLNVSLLRGALLQLGAEMEEASAMAGASWFYTQWRIVRPLVTPVLLTVGLFTFVNAVVEVSSVILLASAGTRTLSLLSLNYVAGMTTERGAASVVILVMTALSLAVALIARAFGLQLGVAVPTTARAATAPTPQEA